MKFLKSVLLAAALVPLAASASVTFQYQNIALAPDGGTAMQPKITSAFGNIVLTDAAAASGHVDFTVPFLCSNPTPGCAAEPNSPIVSFFFNANNQFAVDLNFITGASYYLPPSGSARFDIIDGVLTNIDLGLRNGRSEADLRGLDLFYVDEGGTCFFRCSGATGQFVQVNATGAVVPEPATIALFGLGLLGMAGGFIRRR